MQRTWSSVRQLVGTNSVVEPVARRVCFSLGGTSRYGRTTGRCVIGEQGGASRCAVVSCHRAINRPCRGHWCSDRAGNRVATPSFGRYLRPDNSRPISSRLYEPWCRVCNFSTRRGATRGVGFQTRGKLDEGTRKLKEKRSEAAIGPGRTTLLGQGHETRSTKRKKPS